MNHHVPNELLQAFVDGEVSEQIAVHVATHLDGCPACATRAAGLEPLAAAFAAVEDPVAPDGLKESVLALLDRPMQFPERFPFLELSVGSVLLSVAAAIAIGLQGPAAALADIGISLQVVDVVARGLGTSVGSFQLALVASALLLAAGAGVTWLAPWAWASHSDGPMGWGSPGRAR